MPTPQRATRGKRLPASIRANRRQELRRLTPEARRDVQADRSDAHAKRLQRIGEALIMADLEQKSGTLHSF